MKTKIQFKPRVIKNKISYNELMDLLFKPTLTHWKRFFCFHNWIYWRYADFGKVHRVCSKCYKKEKNSDVLNKSNYWIRDHINFKLSKKQIRKNKFKNILK